MNRHRLRSLCVLAIGLWPETLGAQSDVAFPTQVYVGRRAALLGQLPEAVVVVPGRYLISPGDEPVKQDPDFWYLTGVESPYAVLVMEQAPPSATALRDWRSFLFVPGEFQFAGGQFPMADSLSGGRHGIAPEIVSCRGRRPHD